MDLRDINKGVMANCEQDTLLLAEPKKKEPISSKVDMSKEKKNEDKGINSYYSGDIKDEVKYYKAGGTGGYTGSSSSTSKTSSSSYGYSSSYGSSSKYGTSSNSKVGLYGGANLNYNERLNALRRKSKEIAGKEKATMSAMKDFEGEYKFTISKTGRVKKKKKVAKKGKKFLKQIAISVATICLEVALGVLISSAKVAVEKIVDEVKNAITRKEVIVNA